MLRLLTLGLAFLACTASRTLSRQPTRVFMVELPPDGLRLSFADPQVRVGDRIFFDTRFSQFFFEHANGNVNASLSEGDPLMNIVDAANGPPLPGPFRGQGMNCRHCHLGDDFLSGRAFAGRTYCDFSRRSPIPKRGDGVSVTSRNSPVMVGLGLPREVPRILHSDGEFVSEEDLTIDTLTGRNFGWLPEEAPLAVAHIASVIRKDAGSDPRHVRFPNGDGVPYRVVLLGKDPSLPPSLRIPAEYRIDVHTASDGEVLQAIARLVHAYMDSIRFGTHNTFRKAGSPYDLFLEKNRLPLGPEAGESALGYAERLERVLDGRQSVQWVTTPEDGEFKLHDQRYQFGETELRGLKVFFARASERPRAHVGNCIACHIPPQFTDHGLHNNGASQVEYDALFGEGAFEAIEIPGLVERNGQYDAYLPSSAEHPRARSRFRSVPSCDKPGFADLGVWNIFANPDMPKPQVALARILCGPSGVATTRCTPEAVLPLTVGYFKTPTLRDLGQSDPYLHSGGLDTIEEVVRFYMRTSALSRGGRLRSGSPELAGISLDASDIVPLVAFLKALNEDYR